MRRQKLVTDKTVWTNFGATQPGLLPAGGDANSKDLVVYENVSAVVETEGKHAQVAIGTLIQADQTWRLIDMPSNLLDEKAVGGPGGYFFNVAAASLTPTAGGAPTAEMQKFTDELERIEQALAKTADPEKQGKLNAERADVLEKLFKVATTDEERANWMDADEAGGG